jgi:pSer/pThr/pTyr-binding forkhead associated (FHA) protein
MNTNLMELFLQACRWLGPLRFTVAHSNELSATQLVLHQPFALVGCDPRTDLFLNHPVVSRRHAYLQVLGGRLFCVDLQSRTGIHWDDGPKRSGWLEAEQPLRIGPFQIRANGNSAALPAPVPLSALYSPVGQAFQPDGVSDQAGKPDLQREEELPEVALEFVNRLPEPTVWRMSSMLALVGRAALCRVRLMGESVSKFHCSLVRTPLGVWVVDLFGKGGIRVNEVPVRCARLEEGDRLQVGHFIIRARFARRLPSRVPFSHLVEATVPAHKPEATSAGSSGLSVEARQMFTLPMTVGKAFQPDGNPPALQETGISAPAASLIQGTAVLAQHLPGALALPLAGSSTEAEADRTKPPGELLLPLLPQVLPTTTELAQANTEAVQSLLVPIAQHLGTMQHQMFEQFQQAMMMMFQMFGKLQREQIKVIREEMDRLHQLSREVMSLQAELSKHTPAAPDKSRVGTRSADHATTAAAGPRLAPAYNPAANPSPRPTPAPNSKPATESKPLPLPQKPPEKDMHAWLSQRIAALQEERQSRWQKIVSFLGGLGNTAAKDGQP